MRTHLFAALFIVSAAFASEADFTPKHITAYPFVASPERAATITATFQKVSPGMTPKEVKALLGEPDEVRPLYDPRIKTEKNKYLIGHTYWYVLRRAKESGSVEEKAESLVRVSFGEAGTVLNVDRW